MKKLLNFCGQLSISSLLLILFVQAVRCDRNEEDWIEPNAWGRAEQHPGLNLGAAPALRPEKVSVTLPAGGETCASSADNAIALVYYKKFIATLFNRKKLQYDAAFSFYQRSVLFTILPAQLEKLEQLSDPRDLDVILTEIFTNARSTPKNASGNGNKGSWSVAALIWDIFKDLAQLLRASEVRFLLMALSAILLCWFLHRRYQVGLICMIVGGILLFGYIVTYLECNRKLEVEQMLEVLESEEQPTAQDEVSWHTPLTKWLYAKEQPLKQERKSKIKKHSKINLGFCRPDHVLLMYANEMFLKQLEFLLEKCTETLVKLKDGLSFPYNILAGAMLLGMIAYIVKLTFEYILSPNAWASLLHRPATSPHHQQYSPPATSGVAAIGGEDRISGQNLQIILNAFSASSAAIGGGGGIVKSTPQAVSGVQEILEHLEAAASSSPSSSSGFSPKSKSANSSIEEAQPLQPSVNIKTNVKVDASEAEDATT